VYDREGQTPSELVTVACDGRTIANASFLRLELCGGLDLDVFQRLAARLKEAAEKSEKQIPRGLKCARDDKNKGLIGMTKVMP
jgi:hypothetical protein